MKLLWRERKKNGKALKNEKTHEKRDSSGDALYFWHTGSLKLHLI